MQSEQNLECNLGPKKNWYFCIIKKAMRHITMDAQ